MKIGETGLLIDYLCSVKVVYIIYNKHTGFAIWVESIEWSSFERWIVYIKSAFNKWLIICLQIIKKEPLIRKKEKWCNSIKLIKQRLWIWSNERLLRKKNNTYQHVFDFFMVSHQKKVMSVQNLELWVWNNCQLFSPTLNSFIYIWLK